MRCDWRWLVAFALVSLILITSGWQVPCNFSMAKGWIETFKSQVYAIVGFVKSLRWTFSKRDILQTGSICCAKPAKVGKKMSEEETMKNTLGHTLSKEEGLTNGGNNVSSDVPDEMTEVCWNDILIDAVQKKLHSHNLVKTIKWMCAVKCHYF